MAYNVVVTLICDNCGVGFPRPQSATAASRVTGLTAILLRESAAVGWSRVRGDVCGDGSSAIYSHCPDC